MKATYKFNLPEQKEDHEIFLNANNYQTALWEIERLIRQWDRYDDREQIDISELKDAFYKILKDCDAEI
jgi:hypothetical protein